MAFVPAMVGLTPEGAPVRRRAWRDEVPAGGDDALEPFVENRLLITDHDPEGRETIEVAHEALLRVWAQLVDWLNRGREFLLWRERLRYARDEDTLLEGQRLVDARHWLKTRGGELPEEERSFTRRSVRHGRQRLFRSLAVALLPLLTIGSALGFFWSWYSDNELSPRAGWYVLLARTGVYTLQPEMVQVPPAKVWRDESKRSFMMGSDENDSERPQHLVTFTEPFRMGKYEVTFDEYQVFAYFIERDGGCRNGHEIDTSGNQDEGWGRGRRPLIKVRWEDAVCYAEWLNEKIGLLNDKIGKKYRLPTEAEWEYAARAGTTTNYWWGGKMEPQKAVCKGCDSDWSGKDKGKQTAEVDDPLFQTNGWGLYHTLGNVFEWVQECWHDDYQGAPEKGDISWEEENGGECSQHVFRGGSW